MKNRESGNILIYLGIFLALIVGCYFLYSWLATEKSSQIIVNLLTEYPMGVKVSQKPQSETQNGRYVLWHGLDGKCIPDDCKPIFLPATTLALPEGCSGEVMDSGIEIREFKPKPTSAMYGTIPLYEVVAIGLFDTTGCQLNVVFSNDFMENGSAIAPPEPTAFLSFWESAECKVSFYGKDAIPCDQMGYYPEGAILWVIPMDSQSEVHMYKINAQGGPWPYPLESEAVTPADIQYVLGENKEVYDFIKKFYFMELFLPSPTPTP